jgi:hypothetical protein
MLFIKIVNVDRQDNLEFIKLWNNTVSGIFKKYSDNCLISMCENIDKIECSPLLIAINSLNNDSIDFYKIRNTLLNKGLLNEGCQLLIPSKIEEPYSKTEIEVYYDE